MNISKTSGGFALGIDIGTTNISATVIDPVTKKQIEVYCFPNRFEMNAEDPHFREQDARGIVDFAEMKIAEILSAQKAIASIGITGQMHGIVYVGQGGEILSPLYTWQDKRGDMMYTEGETYCEAIRRITGRSVPTGYGLVTHAYNLKNGLVPEGAAYICSIMDALLLRLTGARIPTLHSSVAASFGFFDVDGCAFMEDKLSLLGISASILPSVSDDAVTVGAHRGIPVAVAIGDNQASFLGAVTHTEDSVLINIGTGSQISFIGVSDNSTPDIEIRPLTNGRRLVCGSALCGGSAYAVLERFFREYAQLLNPNGGSQYEIMNALAEAAYGSHSEGLAVDTAFCGTRSDPSHRGQIFGIDTKNFTPANLTLGVLYGIASELYELYRAAGGAKKAQMIASGGAVRKNGILQKILEEIFGMPCTLSIGTEEAAVGAARIAAFASGMITGAEVFSEPIPS